MATHTNLRGLAVRARDEVFAWYRHPNFKTEEPAEIPAAQRGLLLRMSTLAIQTAINTIHATMGREIIENPTFNPLVGESEEPGASRWMALVDPLHVAIPRDVDLVRQAFRQAQAHLATTLSSEERHVPSFADLRLHMAALCVPPPVGQLSHDFMWLPRTSLEFPAGDDGDGKMVLIDSFLGRAS